MAPVLLNVTYSGRFMTKMAAGSILGIVSGSAVCPDVNSSASRGYHCIPLPLVTPVLYRVRLAGNCSPAGASHDAAERRFAFLGGPDAASRHGTVSLQDRISS